MTVKEIHELAIAFGKKNDFRMEEEIVRDLTRRKQKYEKLSDDEKELYDKDLFENPYADTRILYDSGKDVNLVLAGIDIETAEVLLADRLGGIDCLIPHHPVGKALARLDEVMHYQADILEQYGVPIGIAESLLKLRISEVSRGLSPRNHERAVDAAKKLDMSLQCVHTPADNMAAQFLKQKVEKANPRYVSDLLELLRTIPEYCEAIKLGMGPMLFAGDENRRCGKIAFTEITGGTEGSAAIYERLAHAGIGTIIGMHMSEKHKENVEAAHINAVVAGHMSTDSIGMNLFLDELEKKGVEVIACSGLIRVSRT